MFGAFYQVVRALGPEAGFLRAPIVARAARRGTNPDAARRLSDVLPELPVSPLSADEQRILADPSLRAQAAGLIRSAADNGQVTNAQLLDWLGQHLDMLISPNPAQRATRGSADAETIAAIRQAFCRRGSAANEVLTPLMTCNTPAVCRNGSQIATIGRKCWPGSVAPSNSSAHICAASSIRPTATGAITAARKPGFLLNGGHRPPVRIRLPCSWVSCRWSSRTSAG